MNMNWNYLYKGYSIFQYMPRPWVLHWVHMVLYVVYFGSTYASCIQIMMYKSFSKNIIDVMPILIFSRLACGKRMKVWLLTSSHGPRIAAHRPGAAPLSTIWRSWPYVRSRTLSTQTLTPQAGRSNVHHSQSSVGWRRKTSLGKCIWKWYSSTPLEQVF